MPSFFSSILALPARTKGILAVSTVAVLGIAFLLLRVASAPSYQVLSSGIDPAQTGKATAALDSAGIAYQLQNNGTALAVDSSQVGQARVALAQQGISLSGANDGFSLFDKQKLGTSQFQEQVTYQRALEGQLANTIDGVSGVSNAQVQLVLPQSQDTIFTDNAPSATAAVMLGNPASTLQPGAVQGIAQLVASSVQGLTSDKVTITDSTGQLLWPSGNGAGGGAAGAAATKQATEAQFDSSLEARLNALLTQTLGPGKAQVQVNSDLDVDKTTKDQLVYNRKGVPTEVTTDNEKLKGSGSVSGGAAGAGANIPTYSAGTTTTGSGTKYSHLVKTNKLAVGKQVIHTDVAPGTVKHLNVALVLDKSVPPAVAASLKKTVASAAGITPARGDVLQMSQYAFAKPATPKAGPLPTSLLGPIKWVGVGLASIVFVFFMMRSLKRRERESLARPAWLTEVEEPMPLAALEGRTQVMEPVPGAPVPSPNTDERLQALEGLMDREPERVAAQVRHWMSED